jgi:hypothetical protein
MGVQDSGKAEIHLVGPEALVNPDHPGKDVGKMMINTRKTQQRLAWPLTRQQEWSDTLTLEDLHHMSDGGKP